MNVNFNAVSELCNSKASKKTRMPFSSLTEKLEHWIVLLIALGSQGHFLRFIFPVFVLLLNLF